jgi:CRISPR-associated protein Cas1
MRRVTTVNAAVAHLVGPGKLKVVNEYLAFSTDKQSPLRLDPQALKSVLCYGDVGVSDAALETLFKHRVAVAWLTPAGQRCRGRLVRSDPSTTALRILQYQALQDPAACLELARGVVAAKIESQVQAARHYQKHGAAAAGAVLVQLQSAAQACAGAATLDGLRGVEGAASAAWFGLLGALLQPPWTFAQRVRRPPTDPVNALLSLGYTWLLTRMTARCEAAGLEVYLGALHAYHPGRPSLACDLIEPLRVPAVDRWVVSLLNQGEMRPEDFSSEPDGVRLQSGIFGRTIGKWENHWHENGLDTQVEALVDGWSRCLRRYEPPVPETEPEAL